MIELEDHPVEHMPAVLTTREPDLREQFPVTVRHQGGSNMTTVTYLSIRQARGLRDELIAHLGDGPRIVRLERTIHKLCKWQGVDIGELIEEGYLEEGDL